MVRDWFDPEPTGVVGVVVADLDAVRVHRRRRPVRLHTKVVFLSCSLLPTAGQLVPAFDGMTDGVAICADGRLGVVTSLVPILIGSTLEMSEAPRVMV